jgi:hypothetical protein
MQLHDTNRQIFTVIFDSGFEKMVFSKLQVVAFAECEFENRETLKGK